MSPCRATGRFIRPFGLAAAALVALLVGSGAPAAPAPGDKPAADKVQALSKEDQACLECHAKPDLKRTLGDGKTLALHVSPKAYAEGVHGETGCDGCHTDIDDKTHGKKSTPLADRRTLAKSMVGGCVDCHKKTVKQYDDSVHAAMVQAGSDKAPLCSDCHDAHVARSHKESPKAAGVPCQTCHEGVVAAFRDSVHGEDGEDLSCADCHRTHNVKAASFGDAMKNECLACHQDTVATHKTWLPNTGRHLAAVACAACHSPGAQRRVNLRLYEGGQQVRAGEKIGVPQFVRMTGGADAAKQGLDDRALWSLLQEFNRDGDDTKMVLRGRLEVKSGAEAHRLGPKAKALSDCATCHKAGAEPFQTISVTMAGPDGRALRHEAQADVLHSIRSVESVGGFYALGGTRIKVLDWLLLLALAGGIAIPSLHLTVKLLSQRARARRDAEAARSGGDAV